MGEGVYTEPIPGSLLTERETTQHAKCIEREKQGATSFSCDKSTATSLSVTLRAEMETQGRNTEAEPIMRQEQVGRTSSGRRQSPVWVL